MYVKIHKMLPKVCQLVGRWVEKGRQTLGEQNAKLEGRG